MPVQGRLLGLPQGPLVLGVTHQPSMMITDLVWAMLGKHREYVGRQKSFCGGVWEEKTLDSAELGKVKRILDLYLP